MDLTEQGLWFEILKVFFFFSLLEMWQLVKDEEEGQYN